MAKAKTAVAAPAKAKSAAPNPFASATRITSVGKTTKKTGVYVASTPDEIAAITGFCEGKRTEDQGKAMKELNRPLVLNFGLSNFVDDWLISRKRPDNPAIRSSDQADAAIVRMNLVDKAKMLNDESYQQLANLIGAEAAEQNTVKGDVFVLNSELLEQDADVMINGTQTKMRVMDAIAAAFQQVFAPSPEVCSGLFSVKQVFTTAKGLIDKGPALVAPDNSPTSKAKLIEFIDIACATPQLKAAGGSGD